MDLALFDEAYYADNPENRTKWSKALQKDSMT